MLTKDLLKFRNRSGKIYPSFISAKNPEVKADASELVMLVAKSVGTPIGQLEEDLKGSCSHDTPGLVKLLLEQCELAEDDGKVLELRWKALELAQQIRVNANSTMTVAEYDHAISHGLGVDVSELRSSLYSDLPDQRKVMSVKTVTPEWLVHRYNVAQVQGLLLRASKVTFEILSPSYLEMRAILRHLRFHRLLAEIEIHNGDLKLTVSGPLSIFEQAQTYGSHIANFFPHVIKHSKWRLNATLQIKNRDFELELDDKTGLVSHYKQDTGYIPEEITGFTELFQKRYSTWKVEPASEVLNLGGECYAIPDLKFTSPTGEETFLEVFHSWHQSGLASRLKNLQSKKAPRLKLAVCQKFGRSKEGAAILTGSDWFTKNGCFFSSFPTPKAIWALLN